jgi:hypothetical protein
MRMPIPSRRRALELGATFLESDLHEMRGRVREQYEHQQRVHGDEWDGREFPLGTSHEGDLMKAVEWAWSAATLRAMAEQEPVARG